MTKTYSSPSVRKHGFLRRNMNGLDEQIVSLCWPSYLLTISIRTINTFANYFSDPIVIWDTSWSSTYNECYQRQFWTCLDAKQNKNASRHWFLGREPQRCLAISQRHTFFTPLLPRILKWTHQKSRFFFFFSKCRVASLLVVGAKTKG